MNHQQLVGQFHEAFGVDRPKVPTMPDEKTRRLRCKLIFEEAIEYAMACGFFNQYAADCASKMLSAGIQVQVQPPNMTEMADALADIEYVTHGANEASGVDGDPIFREVHRSNMSKQWIEAEVLAYNGEEKLTFKENEYCRFIAKNESGKVIKSPGYSKADIAGELIKQGACI